MKNQVSFGLSKNQNNYEKFRSLRVFLYGLLLLALVFVSTQTFAQIKEITYIVTVNCDPPKDNTVILHIERGYEFIPMTQISDNQWRVTVDLPKWWTSGTERYKYCWNSADGTVFEEPNGRDDGMRQVILDNTTTIIDTVDQWQVIPIFVEEIKKVTYNLTVNCYTPEDEVVVLHIERGYEFIPMTRITENQWQVTVDLPNWWETDTERYKYCRNFMAGGADEVWDGRPDGMREVTLNETTTINDVVNEWRWLPLDGKVPEINTSAYLANPPAKLPPSSFMCGTALPDYWWEKSFSPVVHQTLDRIVKETNSNWVQYNPIVAITQFTPTVKLDTGSVSSLYTSDKDLRKIIEGAHKRGLKVFLHPFTWSIVQDPSPELHSTSYWTDFESQWREIILYYARIAQEYQVEMLSFSVPAEFDTPAKIQFIDNLYQKLLADVRAVYKGPIAINYSQETNYEIYNQCDYLIFTLFDYWPFKISDSTTPTVEEMVSGLNTGLNEKFKLAYDAHKKPIILTTISSSSYNGSVRGSIYWEDVLYWFPDDPSYPVDLQEQADAYESMLQAISANEWIAGAFSFNYNHWNSLDKAPSVRYKPAEKVLAKWWKWILPDNVHLTVAGTIGGDIDPGVATFVLKKDTTIVLTAKAAEGYQFEKWTGDVTAAESKSNPLSLQMNTNKMVKANFEKLLPETVVLNLTGSDYGNIEPGSASYVLKRDTTVIVTATAKAGYKFFKWAGDVNAGQEKSNPLSLLMNTDKTIKASFTLQNFSTDIKLHQSNQFYLNQNYPNPCKSTTIIQYKLPSESMVSLAVYNINGAKVAALINAYKKAGEHTFVWDNIDLGAGIYLYKLTVQPEHGSTFSGSKIMQVL